MKDNNKDLYSNQGITIEDLTQMADAIPQLVWIADENGHITYCNKRIREFGITEEQVVGQSLWKVIVAEQDSEVTLQQWADALRTGTPYEQEHRLKQKDGILKWHLSRAYPQKNEKGINAKWFGTTTLIDKQKQNEERLEKLIEVRTSAWKEADDKLSKSNEELEQFAYVVSHDLQEPLRKIKSFGELLKGKYFTVIGDEGSDWITRMQSASDRMKMFIDSLLSFSRLSGGKTNEKYVDINAIIAEVLNELDAVVKEKGAIIHVDEIHPVKGDKIRLTQLFQNLIGNALKFSRNTVTPTVTITSTLVMGKESGFKLPDSAMDQKFQLIEISDNGIGFEQEDAGKIFGLFQRLHSQREYQGSGVGLSIALKVALMHNGFIEAKGIPDEGATFKIIFPYEEE